jgi:hypothetical protein
MLADNPSLYMCEEPVIRFLTRIPTTWDKTIGLEGKIGQYVLMARKKGEDWYLGAMTDWSERAFNVGKGEPDGSLDQGSISMLKEVGVWMRQNGEAVYGSHAWVLPGEGEMADGLTITCPEKMPFETAIVFKII